MQPTGHAYAASFNNFSDRAGKQDFAPVDGTRVLERLLAVPITEWAYRSDPGTRHVGPVAQDFHAAFGLGGDDRTISTVDASGIAFAAIQGLHQAVQEKDREIRSLERKAAKVDALERDVAQLKSLVKALATKSR